MSSNNDSEKDVFRACAEHSWQEHGPGGRDGEEGRYAKHGINSVEELEAHIKASVQDEKTKGFVASNQREVYMSPPNADGYSTEVILNYQRDENGNVIGGTCVLTDRQDSELKRLHKNEINNSGKTTEIKLQNAYAEIRKEQQVKQAEPEKALTWYEVQQKRAALHTPAENKQSAPQQATAQPEPERQPPPKQAPAPAAAPTTSPKPAPTPQPDRPLSPAEALEKLAQVRTAARTWREKEERRRTQEQERQPGRSIADDWLDGMLNKKDGPR